jgi:hypothetical protein
MKTASSQIPVRLSRRAFTLVEVLFASFIGMGLAGTVVLLMAQSATEQRDGYADTSVEEQAYTLKANVTSCLRSMSANYGFTPIWATGFFNTNGTLLGYQSIFIFYPTNGAYNTATIAYNSSTGQVIYTPNVTTPSIQMVWMSNTVSTVLTEFYFTSSLNLDGSQNNSLVNVFFQMNDNGFSMQPTNNNPASIFRNFSVQMRNDN